MHLRRSPVSALRERCTETRCTYLRRQLLLAVMHLRLRDKLEHRAQGGDGGEDLLFPRPAQAHLFGALELLGLEERTDVRLLALPSEREAALTLPQDLLLVRCSEGSLTALFLDVPPPELLLPLAADSFSSGLRNGFEVVVLDRDGADYRVRIGVARRESRHRSQDKHVVRARYAVGV